MASELRCVRRVCVKYGSRHIGPEDSASSDLQVFSWILGTTSPHVSPHGALFAGVVGLRREGWPQESGTGVLPVFPLPTRKTGPAPNPGGETRLPGPLVQASPYGAAAPQIGDGSVLRGVPLTGSSISFPLVLRPHRLPSLSVLRTTG